MNVTFIIEFPIYRWTLWHERADLMQNRGWQERRWSEILYITLGFFERKPMDFLILAFALGLLSSVSWTFGLFYDMCRTSQHLASCSVSPYDYHFDTKHKGKKRTSHLLMESLRIVYNISHPGKSPCWVVLYQYVLRYWRRNGRIGPDGRISTKGRLW